MIINGYDIDRALLIRLPFIDYILDGSKTWELRGSKTHIRGSVGLIQSKSGLIVGKADVVDCIGPLSTYQYEQSTLLHQSQVDFENRLYPDTYAWVLDNAVRFEKPVRYKHPVGAIIWVKLNPDTIL